MCLVLSLGYWVFLVFEDCVLVGSVGFPVVVNRLCLVGLLLPSDFGVRFVWLLRLGPKLVICSPLMNMAILCKEASEAAFDILEVWCFLFIHSYLP